MTRTAVPQASQPGSRSTGDTGAVAAADIARSLAQTFGDAVVEQSSFRDEYTSVVTRDSALNVLRYLRGEKGFNHLSDITAVDHLGRKPRFDVVYQLFSYDHHGWFRIKVRVDEHETVLSTVDLWPGSNWAEREVYDLFGIHFEGHPALHRILLPEGWVGHPLRKDYPMSQITLPRSGATKIPE